ncbi:MAG: adenylosuccinate lyase [Gammaproteobacteria bacterium]|nr:adenylosuccinate lyase [Gammaproteobacteria bacterium]
MSKLPFESLTSVSPLDGRYRTSIRKLANYASEYALVKYRVRVEVEWFLFLNQLGQFPDFRPLSSEQEQQCREIWRSFSLQDAQEIRAIETETNHDVKSVEIFIRKRLAKLGLEETTEMVHFGCTSEDINNLSYALMIRDIRNEVLVPELEQLMSDIVQLAEPLVSIPMLSRTHGQSASPTTVGKELAVFASRLDFWTCRLRNELVYGKMNGAVGNYNAHSIACPLIDWIHTGSTFVALLGIEPNEATTQIEPHDYIAAILNTIKGVNIVLLDMVRDIWAYISIGYFQQKRVEGQVGSSTMPHKVNPIDFENSEGNLGIANALLSHLAEKLPVSRWQRDLSDSTALRNLGSAIGHSLQSYQSARRGLKKLELDSEKVQTDLSHSWEVLSEAVQTVMRLEGIEDAYTKVKELTQGSKFNRDAYVRLLASLDLSDSALARLRQLEPSTYVGLASELAERTLEKVRSSIQTR